MKKLSLNVVVGVIVGLAASVHVQAVEAKVAPGISGITLTCAASTGGACEANVINPVPGVHYTYHWEGRDVSLKPAVGTNKAEVQCLNKTRSGKLTVHVQSSEGGYGKDVLLADSANTLATIPVHCKVYREPMHNAIPIN